MMPSVAVLPAKNIRMKSHQSSQQQKQGPPSSSPERIMRRRIATSTRLLSISIAMLLFCNRCRSFQAPVNRIYSSTKSANQQSPFPFVSKQRLFPQSTIVRSMALVPLPVEDLDALLARGVPTGPQYATYWGRTKREQYNRFVESFGVMLIGLFFSYFLSFVLGGFVATILGCLFGFWGILSPDLKARQRNWELLGGRQLVDPWSDYDGDEDKQGLYGALFLGRIDDVCVVEDPSATTEFDLSDFDDYTMDTDELEKWAGNPYLIRVRLTDDSDRELQVHARMSEEYLDIEPGMPVAAVLLSKSQKFVSLAALTDVFVPDAKCWVGDYPYLDRPEIEALLEEDDELYDLMQDQADDYDDDEVVYDEDDDDDGIEAEYEYEEEEEEDNDDSDDRYYDGMEPVPVPIRKRRK